MSRCFPFPPPGYEKTRRHDVDLLKKEKDREKKHKKEKKNREKREGKDKEKREKDRSDGKLRDKKEKKDKHRDKKERDRDKDKDKISASDEKRLPGQYEHNNGDKAPDEKKISGKSEVNSGEIFIQRGKERDLDRKYISGEKKFSGQFSSYSERFAQNGHLTEQPKESNFVQEVDRRTRDEARGSGKQLVEKITYVDARKDEQVVRLVSEAPGTLADSKDKNQRGYDKKLDGQGIRDESEISGKAMSLSLPGTVQTKIDKTPIRLEKDIEKRIEGKQKSKGNEGGDRRGKKRKDKDKGKEGQGKDKKRKKDEKEKEKNEHKNPELDKLKENSKVDHTGVHDAKASHLLKENTKSGVTEGNLRKQKDLDTNGFFDAIDIKPSKMPRPVSSHPLMENGKILATPQTSVPFLSDGNSAVNNLKVHAKERKINGLIETQALPISSTTQTLSIPTSKSFSTTAQADQIAKAFKKPHPDSKYLTEVLTVPKMEEWGDFDNQEWLFQGRDFESKKAKVGSFGVDETPQVWSEPLQIEAAEVCALPYVIPY